MRSTFPKEFDAFAVCLDNNDYRYGYCRAQEHALINCWNKLQGYTTNSKTDSGKQ
jgi:hypothetical protein